MIGGGLDFAETKIFSKRAYKWFIDGEFSSTDNKEEIIEINPEDLLRQIQRYVSGETVYIPRPDGSSKGQWGETSGCQQFIRERNAEIRSSFSCGKSIEELSEICCLSYDTVRKIVYSRKEALMLKYSPALSSVQEYAKDCSVIRR